MWLLIGEKNKAEYSGAIKRAYEEELAWCEMRGRDATFGASKGFTPYRMSFQMKNRFPADWRDKHGVTARKLLLEGGSRKPGFGGVPGGQCL